MCVHFTLNFKVIYKKTKMLMSKFQQAFWTPEAVVMRTVGAIFACSCKSTLSLGFGDRDELSGCHLPTGRLPRCLRKRMCTMLTRISLTGKVFAARSRLHCDSGWYLS